MARAPVTLSTRDLELTGELALPGETIGAVVLVEARAEDELETRDDFVIGRFEEAGIASLRLGLAALAGRRDPVSDAAAVAAAAVDRLHEQLPTAGIPVGVLGIGGGAPAALLAAGERPESIRAVLCVGGPHERLDAAALERVEAPVLFVVGDEDPSAFERLHGVLDQLPDGSSLEILAGARDPASDRRSFEIVCDLAAAWFRRHLGPGLPAATETAGG